MPDRPELTVAIATRGRPELLGQALRSIGQQRLHPDAFEVLVVLDGEDEASAEVTEAFAARSRAQVRVLTPWAEGRGLAAARNVCVDEARGRFVRLQDDDDVLAPYALDAVLNAHHRHGPAVAVLGWTGIAPDIVDGPLMHYLAHEGGELFDYRSARDDKIHGFDWFWGGRTSVSSELARTVRFDETLTFGAEDIEFAFRAARSHGLEVAYAPLAKGFQVRAVDLAGFVNRCARQGWAARYVMDKHPGTALERWAVVAHGYDRWDGTDPDLLRLAYRRCRRLERVVDHALASEGWAGVRQMLHHSYHETFKLARAVTFAGSELPDLEDQA